MIAVVGCGNVLMGDDGLGVHVVRELERIGLPESVKIIDAGTRGVDVLLRMEGVEKLVIIDAAELYQEPGRVHRLTDEYIRPSDRNLISLHEFGLEDAIELARQILADRFPSKVIVFAVEVEKVEEGAELSPKLRRALPEIIKVILKELKSPLSR